MLTAFGKKRIHKQDSPPQKKKKKKKNEANYKIQSK